MDYGAEGVELERLRQDSGQPEVGGIEPRRFYVPREEDDGRLRPRAAAERALDLEAGVAQGLGQRVAKPAGADDGAALKG